MKRMLWVSMGLILAAAASANKDGACKSLLTVNDVHAAIGKGTRLQPVFAGGKQKGWRVYGVASSAQFASHGIAESSLMTHVCGIPASTVFETKGDICCPVDTSREFEVTFQIAGETKKYLIARP